MAEFKAHFKSVQPDLGGSLPGNLIFGIPGEAGGYYTIQITQPDISTMRLTFLPSKQDMDQIDPVDIILPEGPKGDPGQADEDQVKQFIVEYLTQNPPKVEETDPTVPDWAKEKTKPSYSKSEVGLGNVDNVKQYSPSNPPPYPVVSVNGQTGKVQLGAGDVGARPSNWIPTVAEVGALPDTYVPPDQTAAQVGADPAGTAAAAVSAHNTSTDSHGDLRLALKAINDRLTAFFDSDNQTLDELSEIVAYITSNKALIDSITTSKVSVADIINNLTTNVANKPLSAAQGVALKGLIDGLSTGKLDANKLQEAVNDALAQAKESGEFDGPQGPAGPQGETGPEGQRGTGILKVTTAPSSYTTATGGFTPTYRIALSTVLSQAKVTEVLVGDTVAYSYYHYPVGYVDSSYVYLGTRVSMRGATGAAYTLNDADKNTIAAAVKASLPTLTVTGIDADGVSHSWTMYGVAQ